jgi:hypothetical protein
MVIAVLSIAVDTAYFVARYSGFGGDLNAQAAATLISVWFDGTPFSVGEWPELVVIVLCLLTWSMASVARQVSRRN